MKSIIENIQFNIIVIKEAINLISYLTLKYQ